MKTRTFIGVLTLLTGLGYFALQHSTRAASRVLPFQGQLKDAQGNPVPDGAKVVQFKIYDAPVGGQAVWNGEVQKLTVNGGLVSTLLGTKANLSSVDFNRDLYLELTMDANSDDQITVADPPLLPRQSILPAVFAKEAADSRLLAGHDWSAIFGVNDPVNGKLNGSRIQPDSITALQITSGTITSNQIAAGGINSLNIAKGAVGSQQITIGAVGALQIADGAITQAKRAPANIQISEAHNFECNGCTGDVDVANLTVTLTTSGRPVFVGLVSGATEGDNSYIMLNGPPQGGLIVMIFDGPKKVATHHFWGIQNQALAWTMHPVSSVSHIYIPAAGVHTFTIKINRQAGQVVRINDARLVAYEL